MRWFQTCITYDKNSHFDYHFTRTLKSTLAKKLCHVVDINVLIFMKQLQWQYRREIISDTNSLSKKREQIIRIH